ncbi:hypothetical protein MSP8886_01423 [Marinomonas spartinae]|uniref:Uncharacterized protein n=1 Tax=Marinomonas spartinae TaxID=1792290 RepID=A0A1A8TAH4_9GAMM|nr:hypothetical protein [Marinomonas spartinae]SBS29064.1 hypothetical protein MSP8886_01423 [Marinomonas spartinae]
MSDLDSFKELIAAQRIENKEQFAEQRRAITELVKSVSELSSILARSEERHLRHDDGVRRHDNVLDDHEIRIRRVEVKTTTATGSWKTITFLGSFVAAVITIALNYWGIK